jgi:hypothetical protein
MFLRHHLNLVIATILAMNSDAMLITLQNCSNKIKLFISIFNFILLYSSKKENLCGRSDLYYLLYLNYPIGCVYTGFNKRNHFESFLNFRLGEYIFIIFLLNIRGIINFCIFVLNIK